MGTITTCLANSFKAEVLRGLHDFTQNSGDLFKVALIKANSTGSYGPATQTYDELVANGDEVVGAGYAEGGIAIATPDLVTPQLSVDGLVAFTTPNLNFQWDGASFSTQGFLLYNASNGNRAVYVGTFPGVQTVAGVTFTITMPNNTATDALIRITNA